MVNGEFPDNSVNDPEVAVTVPPIVKLLVELPLILPDAVTAAFNSIFSFPANIILDLLLVSAPFPIINAALFELEILNLPATS